ncbi:MAG: LysE family transporter [Epsilonproteobacteria bacterium]|nr:LysE family transporter [Campylobacterota bacterium]
MGTAFFQGLLLGYGAAVPLGPINVIIMNYALKSYKKALMMGLGAMSADITYLALILFGVLKLIEGTAYIKIITILGALFLLYLAYTTYTNRHKDINIKSEKEKRLLQVYMKGFMLTFLNPYTVGFWISVATLAEQAEAYHYLVVGLIFAILSWIILMPLVIYRTKHLFSERVLSSFSLFSSVVLVTFGLVLLYSVFR